MALSKISLNSVRLILNNKNIVIFFNIFVVPVVELDNINITNTRHNKYDLVMHSSQNTTYKFVTI